MSASQSSRSPSNGKAPIIEEASSSSNSLDPSWTPSISNHTGPSGVPQSHRSSNSWRSDVTIPSSKNACASSSPRDMIEHPSVFDKKVDAMQARLTPNGAAGLVTQMCRLADRTGVYGSAGREPFSKEEQRWWAHRLLAEMQNLENFKLEGTVSAKQRKKKRDRESKKARDAASNAAAPAEHNHHGHSCGAKHPNDSRKVIVITPDLTIEQARFRRQVYEDLKAQGHDVYLIENTQDVIAMAAQDMPEIARPGYDMERAMRLGAACKAMDRKIREENPDMEEDKLVELYLMRRPRWEDV